MNNPVVDNPLIILSEQELLQKYNPSKSSLKKGVFSWDYRIVRDRWTEDLIDVAHSVVQTKDIWPICVPTYKRGPSGLTLKSLSKYEDLKVYVFGYTDDPEYEGLKTLVDSKPNWKFVECNFPVKGIRFKRNFIVDYMNKNGTPQFFVIDDDLIVNIYCATKRWENHQEKERRRSAKHGIDYLRALKAWQLTIQCDNDYKQIGMCGLAWDITCSFRVLSGENMDEPEIMDRHCSQGCEYVNSEVLLNAGVNYMTDPDTWEDYMIYVDMNEKGILAKGLRWLTFNTKTMQPSDTVASIGNDTWTKRSMNCYLVRGEIFRLKWEDKYNQVNAKVKGSSLPKWPRTNGNYQLIQDPVIMTYINNNDTQGFKDYVKKLATDINEKKRHDSFLVSHKLVDDKTFSEENKIGPTKRKIGFNF